MFLINTKVQIVIYAKDLKIRESFSGVDELLNEPSWTDKQIIEQLLKTYRFPGKFRCSFKFSILDATTNISVAVMLEVVHILDHNDDLVFFNFKKLVFA